MFRRERRICGGALLALAFFAASPDLAAQIARNDLKVGHIVVTNIGPQIVSESLIRANIRLKEGDPYVRNSIDDDVRNLYSTGYFLNVHVSEDISGDNVNLEYRVQPKPKLTDILFNGNKKFTNTKLGKKLTSKIGAPIDERKLFADAQEIKKQYQKSGYPKTTVEYVLNIDDRAGRGTATFEIKEAPKIRITDVVFDGGSAFSQRKLRKTVKTRRHWMFSWITGSGVIKDEVLDEDKDKLAEYYREAGYIDFELKDVQFVPKGDKKVVVHFVLHEGKQYKVGAIDIKGPQLFATNDVTKGLKMTVGQTFTPKALSKDIESIQDFYGAKGYIDTRVAAHKNPNVQTGTMDLGYELEEGDKSYIEKIEIKGNIKTKDRVIRRELAVSPGEVFDMVRVKLSKERLQGLNYFEDQNGVDAQPEPTDVPNRRNLVVTVHEKNTGNFSIGAGFSSVSSILGFVEISQANFDLFNPPYFMGGGQKMRLRASVGTKLQDYQLTFIEPWFLEKKLQFSVDLYHRDLNYVSLENNYSERRTGGRLGLTRALGSDFLIGGVSYTLENVGIDLAKGLHGPIFAGGNSGNPDDPGPVIIPPTASQYILREAGDRLVSKVGTSLAWDTRNNALLADKGHRTEFRTELAGGPFGGETDYYKLELSNTHYIRGFYPGHILEIAARTGVVSAYGSSSYVPLFDSFFLGGIADLRGYRYRQVGPRDEFNEPIGGGTVWYGSAEYSIPIIDRVRFAFFYDIGMVETKAYHWDIGHYNDNWGLGIRLNLPIGPLRLDYGIPITSDPANKSSGRFQFSVGYQRPY